MTEPLWESVLRNTDFGKFGKLLKGCEDNLKHRDSHARVAFYLRILRQALWKAPAKWSQHHLTFLESRGTEFDSASEAELEFLVMLAEYLRKDRGYVAADPVRKLLDDMLRSYCEDDWNQAVAKVAQVQDELARNSHSVIDSFPMTERDDYHRLFTLCMIACSDVAEQTAADFSDDQNRHLERQSFAALNDLRDSISPVAKRIEWLRLRSYGLPFVAVVVAPPLLVFAGLSSGALALYGSLIWLVVSICLFFMWLKPAFLDASVEDRIDRILLKSYQVKWRARLFRYVQSCGQAPRESLRNLYDVARASGDGDWMNVVLSYIQSDTGLILFGQAQKFVS